MATVQDRPAPPKTDAFVRRQIDRTAGRIRLHDLNVAALGLVLIVAGYGLLAVLLDRWLTLPDLARQLGFLAFLGGVGVYVWRMLVPPIRERVNPYFAARQVERQLGDAKNSVINYLDLTDAAIPGSIRAALSQRAARDLGQADLDRATHDGRVAWLSGAALGVGLVALALMLYLRPLTFFSHLSRAFVPFQSAAVAQQTEIELLEPAGGDLALPVDQSLVVVVKVSGRVPSPDAADALRLRFRYQPDEPSFEERKLEPTLQTGQWQVRVPAVEVRSGLWYRVAGGDAETPEYRVQVRSSPLVTDYEAAYKFRPYTHLEGETRADPHLQALRGTEVTLAARTNRTVQDGTLRFMPADGGPMVPIPGERVEGQPEAVRFKLTLDRDGQYTVTFRSVEGDRNREPMPYSVKVMSDQPPRVELQPNSPTSVPVNGALALQGRATDDFGVVAMRLHMALLPDAKSDVRSPLPPRPYAPTHKFLTKANKPTREVDYRDFQPLPDLRDAKGQPIPLAAGMVLEYYLEADDACDVPAANRGRSATFRAVVGEPTPLDERDQEQQRLTAQQQEHDRKPAPEDANPQPKPPAGQQPDKTPPMPDVKQPEQKQPEGQQPQDAKQPPTDDPAAKAEQELQDKANKLNEQLNKRQPPPQDGNPPPKDEGQPDQQPTAGNEGEAKPAGNKGANPQPKAGPQPNQGEKKPSQGQRGNDAAENKPDAGEAEPQDGGENSRQQPGQQGNNGQQKSNGGRDSQPQPGGEQPQGGQNDQGRPKPNAGKAGQPGERSPKMGNPNEGSPGDKQPGDKQPGDKQPGDKQPGDKQPGDKQPGDKQPGDKQPGDKQPGDKQPGDKQPGDKQPGDKQPGDKQPGDKQPGDKQPGDTKQGDTKQGDTKQGDTKQGDTKQGDTKQGDTKQGDTKQGDTKQGAASPKGGDPKNGSKPSPGENKSPNGQAGNDPANKGGNEQNGSGQKPNGKPPQTNTNDANNKGNPNQGAKEGDQPTKPNDGGSDKQGKPKTEAEKNRSQQRPSGERDNVPDVKPEQGNKKPNGTPNSGQDAGDANRSNGQAPPDAQPPKPGDSKPENKQGNSKVGTPEKQPGTDPATEQGKNADGNPGKPTEQRDAGSENKRVQGDPPPNTKGEGKPDNPTEQPGEAKPQKTKKSKKGQGGEPKAGEQKPGQQQPNGDEKQRTPQEKADAKKLQDMAKEFQKASPERQQQIKDQMQKMQRDSKSPQTKKDAADAQDACDNPSGTGAGQASQKPGEGRNGKGDKPTPGQGQQKPGEGKQGDNGRPKGKQPGDRGEKPGEGDDGKPTDGQGNKPTKPGDNGQPTGDPNRDPVDQAGPGPGNGARERNTPAVGTPDNTPGLEPDAKAAARSAEMQLERLKKNVDKKVLDELKMTPEEFQDFLAKYAAMLKKQQAAAANDQQRGGQGASAANSAAARVKPGATGDPNKLDQAGTLTAPPEFQDLYKAFTADQSKKPAEKK